MFASAVNLGIQSTSTSFIEIFQVFAENQSNCQSSYATAAEIGFKIVT